MILQSVTYDAPNLFDLFESVEVIKSPTEIKKGACLLLHGGADLSPSLYNHKLSKYNHASDKPSQRDILEKEMLLAAYKLNNPIIGICRGAQLLCAVDGGHLVQHIVGHANGDDHIVYSQHYGNMGVSNTAHHQMMVPRRSNENEIIGVINETIVGYEQEDKLREYTNTPEVVYFGALNGLAIQGHPEWMRNSDKFMQSLKQVVQDYLMDK